jgi:multicomponent Na+:H+ antiporter subunit G
VNAVSFVVDAVAALLLLAGCVFFIAGTAGLLRFPDLPTRLHALTKADNLGLGLVLAGVAVHLADPAVAVKLALLWLLALLSASTASQLLARQALRPKGDP